MEKFIDNSQKIELRCYELLKEVLDPELNVSIVDLGLVYEIKYTEEEGIKILMTLTTPGCPLGESIINNIEEVLKIEYPGCYVEVKLTWDPPWSSDFINEEGRKLLGMG